MNRRTMKKIIGLCCATFLLSGCHIYKSYDRPESIDATGIYRDPVAANDTLAANDTTNMGNLSWKEIFRDPKLQMLIEEGLANNELGWKAETSIEDTLLSAWKWQLKLRERGIQ